MSLFDDLDREFEYCEQCDDFYATGQGHTCRPSTPEEVMKQDLFKKIREKFNAEKKEAESLRLLSRE